MAVPVDLLSDRQIRTCFGRKQTEFNNEYPEEPNTTYFARQDNTEIKIAVSDKDGTSGNGSHLSRPDSLFLFLPTVIPALAIYRSADYNKSKGICGKRSPMLIRSEVVSREIRMKAR